MFTREEFLVWKDTSNQFNFLQDGDAATLTLNQNGVITTEDIVIYELRGHEMTAITHKGGKYDREVINYADIMGAINIVRKGKKRE